MSDDRWVEPPAMRRLLALALAGSMWGAEEARAQSSGDSAAVGRVLGAALRSGLHGEVRAVFADVPCWDDASPCTATHSDSTHPLVAGLARSTGASIGRLDRSEIPPCPWGYDPPRPNAGYVVHVARLAWNARRDVAYLSLSSACDNPPRAVHDVFVRDDDYEVARGEGGEWRVVRTRLTRITSRARSPDVPGAPTGQDGDLR